MGLELISHNIMGEVIGGGGEGLEAKNIRGVVLY